MPRLFGASPLAAGLLIATFASAAVAQTAPAGAPTAPPAERNVSATGRVMPPATGRAPLAEGGAAPSSVALEMQKAQKAAEMRNRAWDSKMRKTMGSICSGC